MTRVFLTPSPTQIILQHRHPHQQPPQRLSLLPPPPPRKLTMVCFPAQTVVFETALQSWGAMSGLRRQICSSNRTSFGRRSALPDPRRSSFDLLDRNCASVIMEERQRICGTARRRTRSYFTTPHRKSCVPGPADNASRHQPRVQSPLVRVRASSGRFQARYVAECCRASGADWCQHGLLLNTKDASAVATVCGSPITTSIAIGWVCNISLPFYAGEHATRKGTTEHRV